MYPSAQITSFVLASIGFAVALFPRNYTGEQTGSNPFRLVMWPKLVRFPVFWLGLALLALIVIQALNPAWGYRTDGKVWWMTALPHNEWLPTGVDAPFEKYNQWRILVIYACAWMTLCTIWVALTRRKSLEILFLAIAGNGVALAFFGIIQQLTRTPDMFWHWRPQNIHFFATFVYKNHAASYLFLALSILMGLASWYSLSSERRLEKSSPAGVIVFLGLCTAVAIWVSFARGVSLAALLFLVISPAIFFVQRIHTRLGSRVLAGGLILALLFAGFFKIGLDAVNYGKAWRRMLEGFSESSIVLPERQKVTHAALEMLGDNWKKGIGAGSFRFLFPVYQHRYPDLTSRNERAMFWEHAHNDLVQIPIELGTLGASLIVGTIGYLAALLIRNQFWRNPFACNAVLGVLLLLATAWFDFPFQCPSVLITWWTLLVTATMWSFFERPDPKAPSRAGNDAPPL